MSANATLQLEGANENSDPTDPIARACRNAMFLVLPSVSHDWLDARRTSNKSSAAAKGQIAPPTDGQHQRQHRDAAEARVAATASLEHAWFVKHKSHTLAANKLPQSVGHMKKWRARLRLKARAR